MVPIGKSDRIPLRSEELGRRYPVLLVLLTILVPLGLLLAIGWAAQLAGWPSGDSSYADALSVTLASAGLLCGLALAAVALVSLRLFRRSCVLLTRRGLINRQLWDRMIPWESITEIETLPRGPYWRVRVRLDDGRHVMLAAPQARAAAPHPRFTADRDTIATWWQRHTTSNAPSP